ncbi:E3 ubiquitin-protein ligase E3D [Galendromus occidentalis]|uniref:E3 ubiquitin-protein ligase E3D n=1 Tax=Galendromus occidentalis TaxID=34638 RepID=A0AAJ6QY34_9ACAR|nr:E3 ubiquitin-protein ligase E3D [Galendromus occidentalis]
MISLPGNMVEGINLRVEYRPTLRMCTLSFIPHSDTPWTITIAKSCMRLSDTRDGNNSIDLKLGEGFVIDLESLGDWNTLRWTSEDPAQGSVSSPIMGDGTIHLKLVSQPAEKPPRRNVEVLPDSGQFEIRCKACDSLLTRDEWNFERILPLPSENWQSSQDMWFCHKDDHGSVDDSHTDALREQPGDGEASKGLELGRNAFLPKRLQPKLEDLFYSKTKLMLHVNAISCDSMADLRNLSVICRLCDTIVGQSVSQQCVYFNRMNVDLKDAKTSRIVNSQTPLKLAAKLIEEQVAHGGIHCRLILNSESSGDTLLIWVLENDVHMFPAKYSLPLPGKVEEPVVFSQHHQVLFHRTQRSASIAQVWSSELTVSSETISQETLDSLMRHLEESGRLFPLTENEKVPDPIFEVGYIPARLE